MFLGPPLRRPGRSRRVRTGGSAFTPAKIADGVLWIDFSDAASLTLSGSEITAAANKFGTSKASNATAVATGPTLSTTVDPAGASWLARNGRSYADFNSNKLVGTIAAGVFDGTKNCTIFIVADQPAGAANAWLALGTGAVNTGTALFSSASGTGDISARWSPNSIVDTTGGKSHQDFRVIRAVAVNGVDMTVAIDGVESTPQAISDASTDPLRDDWTDYSIGQLFDGFFLLRGNLGEVLVYNRALTSAEIAQVETYLALKWGTDWRVIDWGQFNGAVAAYSAGYPENASFNLGLRTTAFKDQVGSNDMAPVTGGVNNTTFDGATDPGLTVNVGAGEILRSTQSAVGTGNDPFVLSVAVEITSGTAVDIASIVNSGTDVDYIYLSRAAGGGDEVVAVRGNTAGSDTWTSTLTIPDDTPTVVTMAYDGSTTYLQVGDQAEQSQAQSRSILVAPDRLSFGALDRSTPVIQGTKAFRELYFGTDPSVRSTVHATMKARAGL